MPPAVLTIGHSNHPLDRFLALLARHGVEALVDIRRFPGSRKHPHFNRDTIAAALPKSGVEYHWLETLGGRRQKQRAKWRRHPPFHGVRNGIDAGGCIHEHGEGENDAWCSRPRFENEPGDGQKKDENDAAAREDEPEKIGGPQRGLSRFGGRFQRPPRFPGGAPNFGGRRFSGRLSKRAHGLGRYLPGYQTRWWFGRQPGAGQRQQSEANA